MKLYRPIGLVDADSCYGRSSVGDGRFFYFSRRARFRESAMGQALCVSE